jgi:hypothetical protein
MARSDAEIGVVNGVLDSALAGGAILKRFARMFRNRAEITAAWVAITA